jgi:hypothetical protein
MFKMHDVSESGSIPSSDFGRGKGIRILLIWDDSLP